MFSRRVFLAVVLVCGALRCEAAPSLSFDAVRLGQTWDEFLKAHPKAELFLPSDSELAMTRTEQLARAGKRKEGFLIETRNKQLKGGLYFFGNRVLVHAVFVTDLDRRDFVSKGLSELRPSLREVIEELGPPTAQGATKPSGKYSGDFRQSLLVWKTPTQCAFATVSWPIAKERIPTSVALTFVNSPWRGTKSGLMVIWPAVVAPNQEDETRRRQLIALLEELRPRSTDGLATLKEAPALAVGMKMDMGEEPERPTKPAAVSIKPSK